MPLTKNCEGDNSTYWKKANETLQKVNKWPNWKKNVKIGSSSNAEKDQPTPAENSKTGEDKASQ